MIGKQSLTRWKTFTLASLSAVLLALLEFSLIGPILPTIPRAVLGAFVIVALLAAVAWPYIWWVPGLVVLEGVLHTLIAWGWPHTLEMLLNHWSQSVIGYNLYPWVWLPFVTIVTEAWMRKRLGKS